MNSAYGVLLLVLALLSPYAHAQVEGKRAPPFITTPELVVDRMLRLAGTGPDDLVVDLGSGDGRIVIAAARNFGARGLGLELDPKLVEQSRDAARAAGVLERTEFRVQDILRADFSQASVVTVYLLPWLMTELTPVFLYGLKPGTRVVTHAFVFPGWKPDEIEKVHVIGPHPLQGDDSMIYLWVVPANTRGVWRAVADAGDWQFRIAQNFQQIEVEGEAAGRRISVTQASLNGDQVRIEGALGDTGERFRFQGTVSESRISGAAELLAGPERRVLPLVFAR